MTDIARLEQVMTTVESTLELMRSTLERRISALEDALVVRVATPPAVAAGYVYAVIRADFVDSPELVVKFGATDGPLHTGYPEGSTLLVALADADCFSVQRALMANLRSSPWKPRTDLGREYFEWLGARMDGIASIARLVYVSRMQRGRV